MMAADWSLDLGQRQIYILLIVTHLVERKLMNLLLCSLNIVPQPILVQCWIFQDAAQEIYNLQQRVAARIIHMQEKLVSSSQLLMRDQHQPKGNQVVICYHFSLHQDQMIFVLMEHLQMLISNTTMELNVILKVIMIYLLIIMRFSLALICP